MKKSLVPIALLIALAGCAANDRKSPDASLIDQQFAAWNAHDPDKVASFFTEDVVYEDVTYGLTAHGRDELRKMAAGFFTAVPDLKLQVVSTSIENDHGSVEWIFSGTDAALYKTGKKFSVRGASRFEVRGNKFARNSDFYDAASIMRQVGALPPDKP